MFIKFDPKLKTKAKEMRNTPTKSEQRLWNMLRANFPLVTFLRQKPLDYFIVDFYCFKYKLIIEVDGKIHDAQKERDSERDNLFLQKYNLKTIRILDEDVMNNPKEVIKTLGEYLKV